MPPRLVRRKDAPGKSRTLGQWSCCRIDGCRISCSSAHIYRIPALVSGKCRPHPCGQRPRPRQTQDRAGLWWVSNRPQSSVQSIDAPRDRDPVTRDRPTPPAAAAGKEEEVAVAARTVIPRRNVDDCVFAGKPRRQFNGTTQIFARACDARLEGDAALGDNFLFGAFNSSASAVVAVAARQRRLGNHSPVAKGGTSPTTAHRPTSTTAPDDRGWGWS